MGKVRIKHGENEIEVEGSDAFIKKELNAFYDRIGQVRTALTPATLKTDIQASAGRKAGGKVTTPAEFYKSKNRKDGISQVLIFGRYLEELRGKTEFSRQDINKIASEAKLSKDVHSQYFLNAVKQGLLRSLGGGKYTLTLTAEEALAAMK